LFITAPVQRGTVATYVRATGTIEAVITVDVSSQLSGRIAEVLVNHNEVVKQGQVIARLDPEIYISLASTKPEPPSRWPRQRRFCKRHRSSVLGWPFRMLRQHGKWRKLSCVSCKSNRKSLSVITSAFSSSHKLRVLLSGI